MTARPIRPLKSPTSGRSPHDSHRAQRSRRGAQRRRRRRIGRNRRVHRRRRARRSRLAVSSGRNDQAPRRGRGGRPEFRPRPASARAAAMAAAPGLPREVRAGDDRLAQLCGCNMAITKAALQKVGGFDPMFTAAGDDVDLSWRLAASNETLAYAPGAVVIHERRATLAPISASNAATAPAKACCSANIRCATPTRTESTRRRHGSARSRRRARLLRRVRPRPLPDRVLRRQLVRRLATDASNGSPCR